jgi:hypothetical protein
MFKASQIQGEGSIVSDVQTKFEPSYWRLWGFKNHEKRNRIEKIMAPQSRGGQNSKIKTIECYKG